METLEIGIPIKTPESLVPRDSLAREVLKVKESISNFFRTGSPSFSRVKGIEVKEWGGRNYKKGINLLGVFRNGRVKLYVDAISSEGEPLGEILAHELGHAFCHELRADRGKKKELFGTSGEAFAEWIKVVYKHGGSVQKVDSFFSGYFLKDKKLFDSGITHPYPGDYAKMQDAALLHYIYRSDGLDQVINYMNQVPQKPRLWRILKDVVLGRGHKAITADIQSQYDKYQKTHPWFSKLGENADAWYQQFRERAQQSPPRRTVLSGSRFQKTPRR